MVCSALAAVLVPYDVVRIISKPWIRKKRWQESGWIPGILQGLGDAQARVHWERWLCYTHTCGRSVSQGSRSMTSVRRPDGTYGFCASQESVKFRVERCLSCTSRCNLQGGAQVHMRWQRLATKIMNTCEKSVEWRLLQTAQTTSRLISRPIPLAE